MQLPVIYQDDHLIAINKPSGLLVHRSEIDRHETRFALQLVRNMLGHHVFPVHRLDKPTSGVLLFAKTSEIASLVVDQWRERAVDKRYLAIVRGYFPESVHLDKAMSPPERVSDALVHAMGTAATIALFKELEPFFSNDARLRWLLARATEHVVDRWLQQLKENHLRAKAEAFQQSLVVESLFKQDRVKTPKRKQARASQAHT